MINYLDYMNNPPIMKAFFGNKMPEIDPNDTESIKRWQDWAVQNGHMTQEQVDTGYGIYGPRTKAAYNKAFSTNSKEKSSSKSSFGSSIRNWWDSHKPSSVYNTVVTSSPGLTAITEGVTGLYHKALNAIVDPEKHKNLNKSLSLRGTHRNNASLTPIQNEIYQSIGNYAIDHGATSIDTGLINRWYKDVGQHNKSWNMFLSDDDKKNWRYSNNKIGLLKKQFSPIERVMNTVGRASIINEDGQYYITDVYDHNKSTYVSPKWVNNENATNPAYGKIVYGLQNVHLSDEDPDWQKQSTRIQINR